SLAAELGREREARSMLDTLAARDFEDIPKDLAYLCALTHLSHAAYRLADRPRAERLYALLEPYAALNTPNTLLFSEGSASHPLALLAQTVDRPERAEAHFEAAVELNARMGAWPLRARALFDQAAWLVARGDRRARERAREAESLAAELHMNWL